MIGKTLGHYQVTSQLGKGGMGEVYQAKGKKLGRDVRSTSGLSHLRKGKCYER